MAKIFAHRPPGRAGRPGRGRMCQSSVMQDDISPAQGSDSLAVVSFPERVDVSNADSLRDKLLAVINHGAMVVIADMSATAWCDRAGVDALTRVYQRAVVNGAQLRLVVAAEGVRKLMSSDGLDRLVPIYTSLASAIAAGTPDSVVDVVSVKMPLGPAPVSEWAVRSAPGQGNGSGPGAIDPLVLRRLIDARRATARHPVHKADSAWPLASRASMNGHRWTR